MEIKPPINKLEKVTIIKFGNFFQKKVKKVLTDKMMCAIIQVQ